MKTYKYYVHGKPKTFDLTSLTPEELTQFKAMNNTERLRFIELHHLENIPLWEEIDLKTSTKLSDEGETDRKNKQKYSELFRAKSIKNQLEKMKAEGKELTDANLKKLNDFEYQDVKQNMKVYKDIDSLINYYANKIETLNVDSIDTLKAQEIQNLEAKNISKISVGLDALKSVVETYKAIEEELKKPSEDKRTIIESVLADKEFIDELAKKTSKALSVDVSKEDLSQILNDSGLINEIIKEVKEKISTIEMLTKIKDEDVKAVVMTTLKEYTDKQLTADQVKEIIKENVKGMNDDKINQLILDTETIKAVIEEMKGEMETLTDFKKIVDQLSNQGLTFQEMFKELRPSIDRIMNEYGWNHQRGKNLRDDNYLRYTNSNLIPWPIPTDNETLRINKILSIIANSRLLPTYEGSSTLDVRARAYKEILTFLNTAFMKFDDYPMKQIGQGEDERECGRFLNRFKDYEPDIKRLEKEIASIRDDIKELNSKMQEGPSPAEPPSPIKPSSPDFLKDITLKPSLKPVQPLSKDEPEDYQDLKDILRRRRKDIEPDDTEDDEEEEWGEGINGKVIKLRALMKWLE